MKELKYKINFILGRLDSAAWYRARESDIKDSFLETEQLNRYSDEMLAVVKQEVKKAVKEREESWRKVIKDKEWMQTFLRKHHPELLKGSATKVSHLTNDNTKMIGQERP